jgi:hypothetical protein
MSDNSETVHPIFVCVYGRFVAAREGEAVRVRCERLLAGLIGRVLEVGAGTA